MFYVIEVFEKTKIKIPGDFGLAYCPEKFIMIILYRL